MVGHYQPCAGRYSIWITYRTSDVLSGSESLQLEWKIIDEEEVDTLSWLSRINNLLFCAVVLRYLEWASRVTDNELLHHDRYSSGRDDE